MDFSHFSMTLVLLVLLALAFDFMNGFHDAANSIATVVSTGVLKPWQAVIWAAFFNVLAWGVFHLSVASTVGKGIIDPAFVDSRLIFGALIGAISWNGITWYYGIPSSSSHALIGGMIGAAMSKAGTAPLLAPGIIKTAAFIFISPLFGMLLGALIMLSLSWAFFRQTPRRVDRWFRRLQLISSAAYSTGHGGNDAQKTMGIIVGLLVSANSLFAQETGFLHHFYLADNKTIPYWVEIGAYSAISLGTLFGGWRIVKTMGTRITKLRPVGGFCAETGGAIAIMVATHFGIPVSTFLARVLSATLVSATLAAASPDLVSATAERAVSSPS